MVQSQICKQPQIMGILTPLCTDFPISGVVSLKLYRKLEVPYRKLLEQLLYMRFHLPRDSGIVSKGIPTLFVLIKFYILAVYFNIYCTVFPWPIFVFSWLFVTFFSLLFPSFEVLFKYFVFILSSRVKLE